MGYQTVRPTFRLNSEDYHTMILDFQLHWIGLLDRILDSSLVEGLTVFVRKEMRIYT